MAAANYVVTPKNGTFAQLSTANTGRDGTGTLATVFTAAIDNAGSRVDRISNTPSSTVPAWSTEVNFDGGLILENGASLKASTNNAETFNASVLVAGDFV
jgi:hypothetical protein